MNTLEQKLQTELVTAMKNHSEDTVSAIRAVKTAIQNEKTSGSYHELSDEEIVKIIQKQVKQRQESSEIYKQAGRTELAEKEEKEMKILMEYLPKMLTQAELETAVDKIISDIGAATMKDMGKVMKELGARYPNQYDGKNASTYIKAKLA